MYTHYHYNLPPARNQIQNSKGSSSLPCINIYMSMIVWVQSRKNQVSIKSLCRFLSKTHVFHEKKEMYSSSSSFHFLLVQFTSRWTCLDLLLYVIWTLREKYKVILIQCRLHYGPAVIKGNGKKEWKRGYRHATACRASWARAWEMYGRKLLLLSQLSHGRKVSIRREWR